MFIREDKLSGYIVRFDLQVACFLIKTLVLHNVCVKTRVTSLAD